MEKLQRTPHAGGGVPGTGRAALRTTARPNLLQAGEALARALVTERNYIGAPGAGPPGALSQAAGATALPGTARGAMGFDPRFLVFEFVWNLLLRPKQVEIVNSFLAELKGGGSRVRQMIMGAGKTTVVAPLLALMLADGDSLVVSVVPKVRSK